MMADIVSPEVRSRMMSGIRSRDTKPELQVRKFLHSRGLRFRVAKKDLPGKPDLVLARWRAAIFVHGCFWHAHQGCKYAAVSKTRPDFWRAKFEANVRRDKADVAALQSNSWRVMVIWECALRNGTETALLRLEEEIRSEREYCEIGIASDGKVRVNY